MLDGLSIRTIEFKGSIISLECIIPKNKKRNKIFGNFIGNLP